MKKIIIFITLMMLVMVTGACSGESASDNIYENETVTMVKEVEETMTYTLEELAAFDGKDGNKAYVAVEGVVYDVTGIPAWTGGTHNGNMAGQDVTEAIKNAPHGDSKLADLEVVGQLK